MYFGGKNDIKKILKQPQNKLLCLPVNAPDQTHVPVC